MLAMKTFREKVERLQVQKGLSAADISRRVGRNDGWLSTLWRSDKVTPKTIHLVAKALRVKPEIFLSNEITK